jgi:hypothetical protein
MTHLPAPRLGLVFLILLLSWCLMIGAAIGIAITQSNHSSSEVAEALSEQLLNKLTLPLLAGDTMTTSNITSQGAQLPGVQAIEVRSISGGMIAQAGQSIGAQAPVRAVVSSSSEPAALLSIYPEKLEFGPAVRGNLLWLAILSVWHVLAFFIYQSVARQSVQMDAELIRPTKNRLNVDGITDADGSGSAENPISRSQGYDHRSDMLGRFEQGSANYSAASDESTIKQNLSAYRYPDYLTDNTPDPGEHWQPAYNVSLNLQDAHLMNNLTPALKNQLLDQLSTLVGQCAAEIETSRLIDSSVVISTGRFRSDRAEVEFSLANSAYSMGDHLKVVSAASLFALNIHTILSRFYDEQRSQRRFALPVVIAVIADHMDAKEIDMNPNPADPLTLIVPANLPTSQLPVVTETLTRLSFEPLIGLRIVKAGDPVALDLLRIKNNVLNRNQIF